jgi:hypothetical protein
MGDQSIARRGNHWHLQKETEMQGCIEQLEKVNAVMAQDVAKLIVFPKNFSQNLFESGNLAGHSRTVVDHKGRQFENGRPNSVIQNMSSITYFELRWIREPSTLLAFGADEVEILEFQPK